MGPEPYPAADLSALRVHILGASGRSGAALTRALLAAGAEVVPVVRDPARWAATGLSPEARRADLRDAAALSGALRDATAIASGAHARHIPAILAAAPSAARFAFLGSTRRYTRWPDAHGNGVIAGEEAFRASGRPGFLLHPTMIYGAEGEDNVRRLAALLRRLPFVPLPGGGRALVQPVYQDDVTAALLAALSLPVARPEVLTVAGPTALPYADFVRAVGAAAGLAPPRIMPVPAMPLIALSPLTVLPLLPRIRAAEIRRLLEDKAFDIAPARARLGFDPVDLATGLARTFAA